MTIQNLSQQKPPCSPQAVSQGIHKTTVIFCIFTTALLLIVAFLLNQIGQTPWGLAGTAMLVIVLTAQQVIRKPKATIAATNTLNETRGVD